jgi:lipid-A-disaccharide synthase
MAAEGVELLAGLEDLAVMGFAEVLSRLPFFMRLRRRVFDRLDEARVDLVVPIDYPGFNLRLARRARARGTPVLYYISPQVWAWHASRARDLARDTDRIAVILPFEQEFLARAGASAEFVGHPLLDVPPPADDRRGWLEDRGLDPDRPVLALFPGSRAQELKRHLRLFDEAAARVRAIAPTVQPVIGAAADLPVAAFADSRWPRSDEPRALLHFADAALVKSGTSTLEAALAGTPFVVAYRTNPVSYALARRLVSVPHIALPNLVAEERIVPEHVQHEATAEALADALVPLLGDTPERARQLAGFSRVRERLGSPGVGERVAAIAAELLESSR